MGTLEDHGEVVTITQTGGSAVQKRTILAGSPNGLRFVDKRFQFGELVSSVSLLPEIEKLRSARHRAGDASLGRDTLRGTAHSACRLG
jgi:hypothetical protein